MTVSAQSIRHRWSFGAVLWLLAMTIMAAFQSWRGAYSDGILFGTLVALLAIDRSLGKPQWFGRASRIPRWVLWLVVSIAGVLLVTFPRHGLVSFIVMVTLGVLSLVVAWMPVAGHAQRVEPGTVRSAVIWIVLGIALAVWEATAFVLSVTEPGTYAEFPTISVLLDPFLETVLGRFVFVTLWLLAGVGLVMAWRRK